MKIKDKLKALFYRKPILENQNAYIKKYEVDVLMTHIDFMDEELKEYQNNGYEIAGDILIKNRPTGVFIYIPMKRKIQ